MFFLSTLIVVLSAYGLSQEEPPIDSTAPEYYQWVGSYNAEFSEKNGVFRNVGQTETIDALDFLFPGSIEADGGVNVNDQLELIGLTNPFSGATAPGELFPITATFRNNGSPLSGLRFKVTRLTYQSEAGPFPELGNRDIGTPASAGALMTPEIPGGIVNTGAIITVTFNILLPSIQSFTFSVDALNLDTPTLQRLDKLHASDPMPDHLFGFTTAMSQDVIVVGAYLDSESLLSSGAAYVYRRGASGWAMEAKLKASDLGVRDFFGYSVDVSGNAIVVGAWGDTSDVGAAYVFRFDGTEWVEEAKLINSDAAPQDFFGYSVAIDNNKIAVGAFGHEHKGFKSGASYIFENGESGWIEKARLIASDSAEQDQFGMSVALNDDTVLIGAQGGDFSTPGAAYVFRKSNGEWSEEAKLIGTDAATFDRNGASVAIKGDLAAVGATAYGNQRGAVYLFRRDETTWSQEAKLVANDAEIKDEFGFSLDLSAERVLIGAPEHNLHTRTGSAYVFHTDGLIWTQESKLKPADTTERVQFGISVALGQDVAIAGADRDNVGANNAGSTYVYKLDD